MPKCLPKSEGAKTIFKLVLASSVLIGSSAAYSVAQDEVPTPVPRVTEQEKAAETSAKTPLSEIPLKGADNAPPFDLAKAKLCEAELKRRGVGFELSEPISDPKGCRAERPLRVTSLSKGIKLSSAVIARCEVALGFDDMVTKVIAPSAQIHLDKALSKINTSTSYQCRTRYNAKGTKISEHGFANALDITGFEFDDSSKLKVAPTKDLNQAKFQAAIRAAGCAFFTTVLGPGTNAAHDDHFHFDMAYRKGGYRLCQ